MKQGSDFVVDMRDFDLPKADKDVLRRAYVPTAIEAIDLVFDGTYDGIATSVLGALTGR